MPQCGVWGGGLIKHNATSGDKEYNSMVLAIGPDGGLWAQLHPIMQPVFEVFGSITAVEAIVNLTNYTWNMTVSVGGETVDECCIAKLKNKTKANTTEMKLMCSYGGVCPENKTVANFTAWAELQPEPELAATQ